ncbi:tRNA lysidine(34) synthetase TilS [Seleniivibrio woodruffii]|uniref:tRNA(Ile)-lysidine synthase n=1 Tax=Seleniivibrio woodruffii TaxID=1078050 RepID=A0A4R1K913_9BACT|nr:tRNA lysidine(34) synthetase TilS [Seleniivibrio woodruffii]TCK60868.1 tRNA(Ile)-lysidine synthase [Seleniivibrio woodruffii]TVZ36498.1 tRNA(Ile)-lysidine synthase [Seleniivibrio woodruffii]
MTLSFEKKLSARLGELNGKRLLVAFSGGKDSVSLLHFLKKNEGIKGYQLSACHVNHMYRKTAWWDEKFCSDFCEKYSIPFVSFRCDVPRYCAVKKMSFEHGARVIRYRALNDAAAGFNADMILTAHTRDDLVETFFIQAVQGASPFSLKGIREQDGMLCRLMLDITSEEIYEYLNKYNVSYVIDETNNDENFLRNFIRKNVTAKLAEFRKGYEENIISYLKDSVRFDSYLAEKLEPMIENHQADVLAVKTDVFESLNELEQEYILHRMGSACFRFERRHLAEMQKILDNEFSVRADMPDGYKFEKSDKFIRLYHGRNIAYFELTKPAGADSLYVPQTGKTLRFKGGWKDEELTVRNRRPGDRIKMKKVKDVFIDRKLDLYTRDTALIILEKNVIVWVENISHDASITLYVK